VPQKKAKRGTNSFKGEEKGFTGTQSKEEKKSKRGLMRGKGRTGPFHPQKDKLNECKRTNSSETTWLPLSVQGGRTGGGDRGGGGEM